MKMKNIEEKLIVLSTVIIVAALSSGNLAAQEGQRYESGGLAFTDPSRIFPMPKDWVEKPIRYDSWAEGADLAITLDQHLYPALNPLIETYAKENKLKIAVKEGTCGISAGMLSSKTVDMAGFCCPPGETDRLPGLRFHTLGISALVVLVYPDNPIDNLSLQEARKVFSGEITNWAALKTGSNDNGPDLPIQPIGRFHCKKRPGHWRLLLDNENYFSPRLKEVGSIPDMISTVSTNPRAIGYEVMWMVQKNKKDRLAKVLKINGYSPKNPLNLITHNYPIYRTYNITSWEGHSVENPHRKMLIKYLLEKVGHLDGKFGIVPFASLKESGWKFLGNELIEEPK
jgi:ABC-type phosphate transport system substrate-binding protein